MNSNTSCKPLLEDFFFLIDKRQIRTELICCSRALERVGPMTCVGLLTLGIGDCDSSSGLYHVGISTFSLSKYKLRLGRQSLTHEKEEGLESKSE